MDNLRRMASPAGPLEGRDPVAVTRRFTTLRSGAFAAALAAVAEAGGNAVIADLRAGSGVETLALQPDGTVSLYDGTGAALLGAGARSEVRVAVADLAAAADRALPDMLPADSIGLPRTGAHAITVVAAGGLRRVDLDVATADPAGPIATLHVAVLDVIHAVRRAAGSEV